jgi:hypothetical protein
LHSHGLNTSQARNHQKGFESWTLLAVCSVDFLLSVFGPEDQNDSSSVLVLNVRSQEMVICMFNALRSSNPTDIKSIRFQVLGVVGMNSYII